LPRPIKIVLEAADGETDKLEPTAEHPFWVRDRGWVKAGQLRSGDEVPQLGGGWLRIARVATSEKRETVYNFEVEDFHTYFVGDLAAWVHNTCWDDIAQHVLERGRFAGQAPQQVARYLKSFAESATPTATQAGARIWRRGAEILIQRPGAGAGGTWFQADSAQAALRYMERFHRRKRRCCLLNRRQRTTAGQKMNTSQKKVELIGSESALVVAALFALAEWPFETTSAKDLVSEAFRADGQRLSEDVSAQWRELLEAAGLWNQGAAWTPELIAKRAALEPALALSVAELPVVIFALRAVTEEFSKNWDEFCTVVPGAIQWYPVGPDDVARLARRLEDAFPQ
jgi:hypothetical protein